MLKQYHAAPVIQPPASLDPIFVTKRQTRTSLENLARSYAQIPLDRRKGVQLFEIPENADNCQEYCGRGYENPGIPWEWIPDDTWIELADKTDFSCRAQFEKMFVYEDHYARQWGDGTVLHKCGDVGYRGATFVLRSADPHHVAIERDYGKVKNIWVRHYGADVPKPFFRFQSTYLHGPIEGHKNFFLREDLEKIQIDDWRTHYAHIKRMVHICRREITDSKKTAVTKGF